MASLRITSLALTLACAATPSLTAGPGGPLPSTPEAAMSQFVALNNSRALQSAEAEALLAGELDSITSAGSGELPESDRIVATGKGEAVARLPAVEGSHPDLYFYLRKKADGWRIVAYRTLALTGLLRELVRLDSMAAIPDPELEEAVRNAKLVLSPDQTLIAWASQHRDLLERARTAPASPAVAQDLKAAGALGVRVEEGLVIVSIGGILDNEVGFLWAPPERLPGIDPSHYIWIESAGGDWYLFKTT